jgi:hypothetical protein
MKTVRELIEALQKVSPDAPVALDGYDFLTAWDGTVETLASGTVLLASGDELRDNGTPRYTPRY